MGKECGISYTSVDGSMARRSREVKHLQCHIQWCPPCPSMKKTLVNWSEFSGGPPRWSGVGALALWTGAKGVGLIQHGEEVTSQGPDRCLLECAGRFFGKMVSGCARTRDNNCKLMQESFWLQSRENFSSMEQSSIGRIVKRGCAVSIYGCFYGLTG